MSNEINFTEIDPATLKDDLIARIESSIQEPLYPGDERRIFAEGVCYALAVFIASTNEACRSRLLKYASGYALDALGERVDCVRLAPEPAKTTLRFSLAAARSSATAIPAGTRCTADNTVLFATDESCTVPAGQISVDVGATATAGGSDTNGIPAGTVQTFVDDVPFVAGVVNLTESAGGSEGEPYPEAVDEQNGDDGSGDNRYRERIHLAPSKFSCAGPESAYVYYALSASANISDVSIVSRQSAGRVDVYIVEEGGALPSEATIEQVTAALTPKDVRPLNDLVVVSAPTPEEYDIELTYYCTRDKETETIKAIEGPGGAIEQYIAWQDSKIGRSINPDQLRAMCLDHTVRLDLVSPKYTSVTKDRIAHFSGNINVSHVIVEES